MMEQIDGTENDNNGHDVEVEVCKVIVVFQPLNLTLRRHMFSTSVHCVTVFCFVQCASQVCICNVRQPAAEKEHACFE